MSESLLSLVKNNSNILEFLYGSQTDLLNHLHLVTKAGTFQFSVVWSLTGARRGKGVLVAGKAGGLVIAMPTQVPSWLHCLLIQKLKHAPKLWRQTQGRKQTGKETERPADWISNSTFKVAVWFWCMTEKGIGVRWSTLNRNIPSQDSNWEEKKGNPI